MRCLWPSVQGSWACRDSGLQEDFLEEVTAMMGRKGTPELRPALVPLTVTDCWEEVLQPPSPGCVLGACGLLEETNDEAGERMWVTGPRGPQVSCFQEPGGQGHLCRVSLQPPWGEWSGTTAEARAQGASVVLLRLWKTSRSSSLWSEFFALSDLNSLRKSYHSPTVATVSLPVKFYYFILPY
ncbi:hypothetical protein AAY473_034642 [Plecturocebus cupreus]